MKSAIAWALAGVITLLGCGCASLSQPPWTARLDAVIEAAISRHEMPGAVIWVGRRDETLYRKAYGKRALQPIAEDMSLDTVFDLASLTKVVATATAASILIEEGMLRLSDRVAQHLPEFSGPGKDAVTIRHLLTHTAGLRPSLDLAPDWKGVQEAVQRAAAEDLQSPAGEQFIYSDIGYILLGEIIARVSGVSLESFVERNILKPLGMNASGFRPDPSLRSEIAPTQPCLPQGGPCEAADRIMMRGIVHDPTARRMGGAAGHAGLFAPASDLSRYARMILRAGELDGQRVLAPLSVTRMTSRATPPEMSVQRGLGWDIDSIYSSSRGDLFPVGSFGHTGFTGTSMWVDPFSGVYVILLTNRVHPDGAGDATPLRSKVATIIAAALGAEGSVGGLRGRPHASPDFPIATTLPPAPHSEVRSGIDVLKAQNFSPLRGKRVALLTNQTGLAYDGETTLDLLARADGVRLTALFSPEHGAQGNVDAAVSSSRHAATGLMVHSLYGERLRPDPEMLADTDIVVIDLQDIGSRFYTYATTMAYMLEAAASRQIPVIVLDRVNPINGVSIEGPTLTAAELSFNAYRPMPVRHGMTLGELARYFVAEAGLTTDLRVIPVEGWNRDSWFDETGLIWVNPSPNLRNLVSAGLYPGIATLERANVSGGRGTDTPFQIVGAPWIDARRWASELNARGLPGVRVYPVSFRPSASTYAGVECQGVFVVVTDRKALRPVRIGLELVQSLYQLFPDHFEILRVKELFGAETVEGIIVGRTPDEIDEVWRTSENQWRERRQPYLIYHAGRNER